MVIRIIIIQNHKIKKKFFLLTKLKNLGLILIKLYLWSFMSSCFIKYTQLNDKNCCKTVQFVVWKNIQGIWIICGNILALGIILTMTLLPQGTLFQMNRLKKNENEDSQRSWIWQLYAF